MQITIWVYWCQNKLFYLIPVFVVIYTFLRFYDLKLLKQRVYCFLLFSFINFIFLSLIHLALVQHSLGQIWSTPVRYVTTELANLDWETSIQTKFETVITLYSRFWWITNFSDLRRVSGFFKVFSFEILKLRAFVCVTIFNIISNMSYC